MSETHRSFIPAAGVNWLLPLYDPCTTLLFGDRAYRQLIAQANLQPRQRVLEIGCGTGNVTVLVKRLNPQAEVVGLDPDPKALARARRKSERAALAIHFDRGFADELPYPDASFDRVLSSLMFHHLTLAEKTKTLGEVRRVLAAGGSLHLLDFGGARVRSDGVLARLFHHRELLHDNTGDHLPTLMRAAGFAEAMQVDDSLTLFGRIAYWRASV